MHIPETVDRLSDLDWKAFEAFATGTLQRYYAHHRIDVLQTRASHDGGRDGEGAYTIGEGALTIVYRIWIEVKKRSSRHVGLDDIGKNLVLASNEVDVGKVIVVTNGRFSPQVESAIERFASRNRMAYALIEGDHLLGIAREVWVDEDSAQETPYDACSTSPRLDVRLTLSRQANPLDVGQAADLVVPRGDPVFLIVNLKRLDRGKLETFTVAVVSASSPTTAIVPYTSHSSRLGAADRGRLVFVIPEAGEDLSGAGLHVEVKDSAGMLVAADVAVAGRCRVLLPVLSPWIPPSRDQTIERWKARIERWAAEQDGGVVSFAVVAYPGVGKSLILNRLRTAWLRSGVIEVYLDGALQSRDSDIASLLFEQAFPLSPQLLGADAIEAVQRWLTNCGVDAERAMTFATALCARHQFDAVLCDAKELAELCAGLLRRLSGAKPVIVVIEDLHFCQPSAVDLLAGIHRVLERAGDAHVALFCTTRQFAAAPSTTAQADWFHRLTYFFDSTSIEKTTLDALEDEEAIGLLRRTIPTLQRHHAELIIEQVGTSPLSLREAVAFFRTAGVIEPDQILRQLIVDPSRLTELVDTGLLKKATLSRIQALKDRYPIWLADLLDGAACVGRYFDLSLVLPEGWVWDRAQNEALALCEELDVIRPYDDGLYMFDHDMIRATIIESLSVGRQQRIAAALCDQSRVSVPLPQRGWLLYQSGRYTDAAKLLRVAAQEAIGHYRLADAMKSLRLCLTCCDPEVSTHLGSLSDLDIAVAHAQRPRSHTLDDDVRRQVLDILMDMLACVGSTAVYTNQVADRVLTEANMLAVRFQERQRLADLRAMTGIRHFERDEIAQALTAHQDAERLYAESDGGAGPRAANLLRLAIVYRHQGLLPESQATIRQAHRMAPREDRDLLIKLMLNTGAGYLGIEPARTLRYWRAALRTATEASLVERRVHALIDVGYLELLLDHTTEAAVHLAEGYSLAERFGLENSALRGALNLACLRLVHGEVERARELLIRAEEIGVRQGIGRRLWRVRANLSTVLELNGALEQAYALDAQLARELGTPARVGRPWGRTALPILNIVLRAEISSPHRVLVEAFEPELRERMCQIRERILAGARESLHPVLKHHLRDLNGQLRFLVTE